MRFFLALLALLALLSAGFARAQNYPSPIFKQPTFNLNPIFSACSGAIFGNGSSAATCYPNQSGYVPATGLGSAANGNTAANNTALSALPSTAGPVTRLGYAAVGDAPPLLFTASGSACSLNSGAGDGGLQVPTSDGKCWVANFDGIAVTPRVWGAKGDGLTDDTAAVQAALAAIPVGVTLYTGEYIYAVSSALTTANVVNLVGSYGAQGVYNGTCLNGFRTKTANQNLFSGLQAGSSVTGVCVDTSATNTAGVAFNVGAAANSVHLINNQINGQCIAIQVSSSWPSQTKNTLVSGNVIRPANASGCGGISIGVSSTYANTGDGYYNGNVIYCAPAGTSAAFGRYLHDSGGDIFEANNIYGCSYGTIINPSLPNQEVIYTYFNTDLLGDYSANSDLLIDINSTSGGIGSVWFNGSWASGDGLAEAGPNILIKNTAGSYYLSGIHFVGQRVSSFSGSQNAMTIGGNIKFLDIQDSHICGTVAAGTNSGIEVQSGAYVHIQNNTIGNCLIAYAGAFAKGINIDSGVNIFTITGNDLSASNTIPLNVSSVATTTSVINSNIGVDNSVAVVASASTITLPTNPMMLISGTTAISTINGMWSARNVTLIPQGVVAFNTGGNICNSVTTTAGVPVLAMWDGSFPCWRLK